jgi:hypothetical protein
MSDTNQERKNAVREAWKSERSYVREGNGTRDWSQSEQREILAKGRANGYEGHHMKSVKEYPQYAGDPQNIQFLNRSEHVNGAHKGNTQNATNGYYNPETKTMHSFGNNNPQAPQSQTLSAPLTQKQQEIAIKREQARQQAARQAKTESKQSVTKMTPDNTQAQNSQSPVTANNKAASNKGIESMRNQATKDQLANKTNTAQSSHNKGIEAARQKATASSSEKSTGKTTNQGIESYHHKASGQSTNSSTNSTSNGKSSSSGQER